MKYDHPNIAIEVPAPGHFIITGYPCKSVLTESGHVVPPPACYISPEIPTDLLEAIIAERRKSPVVAKDVDASALEETSPETEPAAPVEKPKRKRRTKAEIEAAKKGGKH